MNKTLKEVLAPPPTPRGVAVSGLVFSILFTISLTLIRLAVPADPTDPGAWIAVSRLREMVRWGLYLVPFAGIAFLWFMAALRSRVGLLEDRYFATVFLGSGLIFVAMVFVAASLSGAILEIILDGQIASTSETYALSRRMSHSLMNVFGVKMAAVFMIVTSSIGIRTAFLPRWLVIVGYLLGIVLLLVITNFAWIALLFPLWVFLVSMYLLATEKKAKAVSS
jgi:hypothetical protein